MTGLFKTLLKFIFVLSLVYGAFLSFFMLKENEMGIVYDLNSGGSISYFSDKYNFVWHGLQPWRYGIKKISRNRSYNIEVKVPLPGMVSMDSDMYYIRIPVSMSCTLVFDSSEGFVGEKKNFIGIESYLKKTVAYSFENVFSRYNSTGYNREKIIKAESRIKKEALELVKGNINLEICRINQISIVGPVIYPENEVYREGLSYSRELRSEILKNKRKSMLLKSELQIEKNKNDLYFKKLQKMSELIKNNPEILKYIYIDKMGPNIKVIISSDRTGLPSLFSSEKGKDSVKKGDIDNLN